MVIYFLISRYASLCILINDIFNIVELLIKYENLAKENVKQKEQIEFLEAALGKDEDGLSGENKTIKLF